MDCTAVPIRLGDGYFRLTLRSHHAPDLLGTDEYALSVLLLPEPLHVDQHTVFRLVVCVKLKVSLYVFECCGVFESWCLLKSRVVCCRFTCPICSKSTQDMSRIWERLDQEVYLTPMPEEYRHKKVQL